MKPEDQVCILELSRKLNELGVPQESLFYWTGEYDFPKGHAAEQLNGTRTLVFQPNSVPHSGGCSAFTSSELGTLMILRVNYSKDGDQWCCLFGSNLQEGHAEFSTTEANARAKLLVYLLENGIINLTQIP